MSILRKNISLNPVCPDCKSELHSSEETLHCLKCATGFNPLNIDNVNHPPHYINANATCECGKSIECIQVTRHLNFNLGNAIKYIWRANHKGKLIEDLKKAVWYLEDEIKRVSR